MKQIQFNVVVQGKNGMLAQSKVSAITSQNEVGTFDVLPNHANFISLIKNYLILHLPQNTQKEFKFTQGVIEVKNNTVNVFIDVFDNLNN